MLNNSVAGVEQVKADISKNIDFLANEIMKCKKCERLCKINPFAMPHVFYNNNIKDLKLMIIGRNPGIEHNYLNIDIKEYMETYKERWLICNFAKYLIKTIGKDIINKNMFFTNICKCSSPNNSTLLESEKNNCFEFLKEQIEIINPEIIFTFGKEANEVKYKLNNKLKIFSFYHPAFFSYSHHIYLQNEQNKKIKKLLK